MTGKGLPAALAGRVKDVLRAFLREDHDPAHTLQRLNDYLCDAMNHGKERVSGAITPSTGTASFSSAGSEPPVLLRADGSAMVIEDGGMVLGIRRGEVYTKSTLSLYLGDTILLVTDGITEARQGIVFLGHAGFVELARCHAAEASLPEMGRSILEGARAFGRGDFRDDACLLLARRR